jgi:hypothetical protein
MNRILPEFGKKELDTWQYTESALKTQETLTSMISIPHISLPDMIS